MKTEKPSADNLLQSLRQGDLTVLDDIYDKHRNDFLRWGASKFRNAQRDDLLDAWQDAVIMFYEQARDGKLTKLVCELKTFLFLIASRRLMKILKKTERIDLVEEFNVNVGIIESINGWYENEEDDEDADRKQLLKEGVDALPEQSRQALTLRYVYGKSISEIKEIMNYASENVVSVTLSRTLKNLKDNILEKTESKSAWKKEIKP